MIEAVIFDYGRTIYNPDTKCLFPGTTQVLDELVKRNLRLGLVSVAESEDIQDRLDDLVKLNVLDYFTAIEIFGRSQGKDFTRDFLRKLGVEESPQRCVVVGDNLKREITLGNKLGMCTVWTKQNLSADWRPQGDLQIPNYTITSLRDLVGLTDMLNSLR